jgi:membrane-bound serine protease (ClpP class)
MPRQTLPARWLLFSLILAAPAAASAAAVGPAAPPLVVVAEVDGVIHPVSADFMVSVMDRADRDAAALVVFVLRTPGGLVDSTRTIVTRMIASRTPVAVLVAPSGARAASAGFLIVLAADVGAMAPGTSIGAAHPVSGDGQPTSDTLAKKAAADVAAYARTLAEKRQRNVPLAEQAVTESRAFTDEEARTAAPPLVDLVARDVADLLRQLDGRAVRRFDGTTLTLALGGTRREVVSMTWRQRVLSAIAHPQIAYLLFSLGTLGLTIELWNPGAVLPGVVGGLCLLLAFFAFQVLPVNFAGLLLLLFGLLLLVLEVKVASFGVLALGGIASLVLGSIMLFDAPGAGLQLGLQLILPVVAGIAGVTLFLVKLAVDAQRRRPETGAAGMLGERGTVLDPIPSEGTGRVVVHGEIWNATGAEAVAAGTPVEVAGLDGLTLTVRRAGPPPGGTS